MTPEYNEERDSSDEQRRLSVSVLKEKIGVTASVAGAGDINPSDATGGTVRAHSATRSPHVHFNVSIESFTATHDGHPALLRRFFVISAP